jgi:Asp-tRNA(Asn)/Glu-tRNA(Gln) amidotransferase A subunit family amidase
VADGNDVLAARVLAIDSDVLDRLDRSVGSAMRAAVSRLEAAGRPVEAVRLGDLDALAAAFRTVQAFEAWQVHGPWLVAHPGAVSGAVEERFRIAAAVTAADADAAREVLASAAARLGEVLANRSLLLPSTATSAPDRRRTPAADIDRVRAATMRLTCVAGAAGAPALSVPTLDVDGAPLGLCVVGRPGSDGALLRLGEELSAVLA